MALVYETWTKNGWRSQPGLMPLELEEKLIR